MRNRLMYFASVGPPVVSPMGVVSVDRLDHDSSYTVDSSSHDDSIVSSIIRLLQKNNQKMDNFNLLGVTFRIPPYLN